MATFVSWTSNTGSQASSEVLASFVDNGQAFYVVRIGLGRYDTGTPYAAIPAKDGIITCNTTGEEILDPWAELRAE